jgi:hypothetical protein
LSIERRDIEAVLIRLKGDNLLVYPRTNQNEDRVYTISRTPIRNYSLERDEFSIIVPYGILGVVLESLIPTVQASKYCKITKRPRDSLAESEDLLVTLSSQQYSPILLYTTDLEITNFEEGSNNDLTSIESDCDIPNFIGNDLS